MLMECFSICERIFDFVWAMTFEVYGRIGGVVAILVVLFMVALVINLLIMPIRGGRPITGVGSDIVSGSDDEED